MEGGDVLQQKIEHHLFLQNKLEKLAALCALVIIIASFLVGWPAISSIMNNKNTDYTTFGYFSFNFNLGYVHTRSYERS